MQLASPAEEADVVHGRASTSVQDALSRLTAGPGRADRLTHLEILPPREASYADWPSWADPEVVAAFGVGGITRPWRHQVVAAEAAHAGDHVVLATGTASGKSLAYQLAALSDLRAGRGRRGERGASTLYLAPTKALAQDQLARLRELRLDARIATHDGDSSRDERAWAREYGEYLLTNPDMLHRSLLGAHDRWSRYLATLRYVVVDECHHYRGVFGAHVAQVLRRLRRVCARYGATPTFVLASATVAEPEIAGERLTGLPMLPVTTDTSPRGRTSIALWQPPLSGYEGERGAPLRRTASAETADLLADLVASQVRTLAFVRSRIGAEQVALTTADLLAEVDAGLAKRVSAYRGGYLPEERRSLEHDLRSGELLGLAATNALELGIDISGLDAVLLAGYPGRRAAFWQQIGRAGRNGEEALGVMVARDDPLDNYLVTHPEALLGQPVEAGVFDPGNPYVLGPHLCAAAQEIPLTEDDLALFGPGAAEVIDSLVASGLLRKRPRGWYWTDRRSAAGLTDIRSTGGGPVQLVESETGRVVGTVDAAGAHASAHPGAVYVHRGETYLVEALDLDERVAVITRADPPYRTFARELTEISILDELEHERWGECRLSYGEVTVSHQVVSFLRRSRTTGEVLGEEPLDLPEQTLRTRAVWWTVPDRALAEAGLEPRDIPGAAHAAEHCSIGLLPLLATCDRWDIGGVSTAHHPDTGRLTVFVYDGHPGGAGFAERGFRRAEDWLRATHDAIEACECESGCPSCIQSPKCGNQNNPLDKDGALLLLETLLDQRSGDSDGRVGPCCSSG
ncbi:MAG: DEAD/DEAH box helicase [Nocardioides sp.]